MKLFGRYTDSTGRYFHHHFFIHVTDGTLHRLAEKYRSGKTKEGGDDNDDLAYFTRVTEFGARTRGLSSKASGTDSKQ